MVWLQKYYRLFNWCSNHVEYIIPLELALLTATLVMVILTIIKDKKSRWLASSLFIMIVQIFLNMHVYCNLFHVVLRKKEIYEHWYVSVWYEEIVSRSKFFVCIVLLLDIAFIVLFCMHFLRNYHTGAIYLILAVVASICTRITGYFTTIIPPTFSRDIFFMATESPGVLCIEVPMAPRKFTERIAFLNTSPKIAGIIIVAALFASLIFLSLKIRKYDPKRNKLFVFPLLIMILEIIRYMATAICEFYYTRLADLRFGMINIIACIICLAWAVYLFKTRSKSCE